MRKWDIWKIYKKKENLKMYFLDEKQKCRLFKSKTWKKIKRKDIKKLTKMFA